MERKNLHIFNSNLNNKFKFIPFTTRLNDSGKIKYLPPVSKEWKNTVYSYYPNNMKNIPVNNINANKIIKNYFNLYFKSNKFTNSKFLGIKKQRKFFRRLYISNLETKHINSKIIMTLYTFNLEKHKLQKNYIKRLVLFNKQILKYWKLKLRKKLSFFMKKDIDKKNLVYNEYKKTDNKKDLYIYKYKLLSESMKWYNLYLKLYLSKIIKNFYQKKLKYLRKYELNYKLNKLKFETLLPRLSNMLSKLYNKKIEFNLVNLKSIAFNSDILTEILTLRIERRKRQVDFELKNLLKKIIMPKTNHIVEKSKHIKTKDFSLIENRYKNLSLLSILNSENTLNNEDRLNNENIINNNCSLNELLKDITNYTSENNTTKDYTNISNRIFNSIKYKNLAGVRLEVRGRLSKRNRADRSVFKLKWKGGLKDITSSYKSLPTIVYRGHRKSNILYSSYSSKRPLGAFAVKGWISGK